MREKDEVVSVVSLFLEAIETAHLWTPEYPINLEHLAHKIHVKTEHARCGRPDELAWV